MKFLFLIAFLVLPFAAYAGEASSPNIRDGWDSIRCGLGVLDTDNYSEQQIVIIHRHSDGADLIIDRYGKPMVRKSIDEKQLSKLVSDMKLLFTGATFSRKTNPDGPFPQFSTILLVDTGLFRDSFYKDLTSDKDSIDRFVKFVDDLPESK